MKFETTKPISVTLACWELFFLSLRIELLDQRLYKYEVDNPTFEEAAFADMHSDLFDMRDWVKTHFFVYCSYDYDHEVLMPSWPYGILMKGWSML